MIEGLTAEMRPETAWLKRWVRADAVNIKRAEISW